MKSSAVALFSVSPIYSVNLMSVKVMLHSNSHGMGIFNFWARIDALKMEYYISTGFLTHLASQQMTFLTDFVALELVLNQNLCSLKVSGLSVAGLGSHSRFLPCRSLPFWLRSCLRGEEESRFDPRYRSPRGTCRVRRSFSVECEIVRKGKKLEKMVSKFVFILVGGQLWL